MEDSHVPEFEMPTFRMSMQKLMMKWLWLEGAFYKDILNARVLNYIERTTDTPNNTSTQVTSTFSRIYYRESQ